MSVLVLVFWPISDFDKQNNMLGPERLFLRLSIKFWALVLTSLANMTAKEATDVMKFQILLIRKTLEQSILITSQNCVVVAENQQSHNAAKYFPAAWHFLGDDFLAKISQKSSPLCRIFLPLFGAKKKLNYNRFKCKSLGAKGSLLIQHLSVCCALWKKNYCFLRMKENIFASSHFTFFSLLSETVTFCFVFI